MPSITHLSVNSTAVNQDSARNVINSIVTLCVSQGMTLVDSRAQAGNFEWSILQKPSSLGTSSLSYYIAFGVASNYEENFSATASQNYAQMCMFITQEYNVNSKTILGYPGRGIVSTTASGTASTSYQYLPGSSFAVQASWLAEGARAFRGYRTNPATVSLVRKDDTFVLRYVGASPASGYAHGFALSFGTFDSILSSSDDPFPVFCCPHYLEGQAPTAVVFDEQPSLFITDPLVLNSPFAGYVTYSNSWYLSNGFSLVNNTDLFTNRSGVSRMPIYTAQGSIFATFSYVPNLRGFAKHLYIVNSVALYNNVYWTYGANSYTGVGALTRMNLNGGGMLVVLD